MEEMVLLFAEKGIVAGGFIYMLYLFLTKFTASQERIADTLIEVSNQLAGMDARIARLEKKNSEE